MFIENDVCWRITRIACYQVKHKPFESKKRIKQFFLYSSSFAANFLLFSLSSNKYQRRSKKNEHCYTDRLHRSITSLWWPGLRCGRNFLYCNTSKFSRAIKLREIFVGKSWILLCLSIFLGFFTTNSNFLLFPWKYAQSVLLRSARCGRMDKYTNQGDDAALGALARENRQLKLSADLFSHKVNITTWISKFCDHRRHISCSKLVHWCGNLTSVQAT